MLSRSWALLSYVSYGLLSKGIRTQHDCHLFKSRLVPVESGHLRVDGQR